MNKSIVILILASIGGLFSCTTTTEGDNADNRSKSFVQAFVLGTSLSGIYQQDCKAVQLSVNGDAIKNQESPEYLSLIDHFKDNAYDQKIMGMNHFAIANKFEGIEITSDKDFSATLKAGASLSEIMSLYSISPIKYIESMYSKPFDWANDRPEEFKQGVWSVHAGITGIRGYYPVIKKISEITPDDLRLLEPQHFYLRFNEVPTEKKHKITVILKCADKELRTTVDVFFQ